MEEQERSRSPSRRTSRVEQVVGRWLRRSRESGSRERTQGDGKPGDSGGMDQRNFPIRVTVQILRDPLLDSHGFSLSSQPPILVRDVSVGGPADGRLAPGDQVLKINSVAIEDLSSEQAADIIRESEDSVTMTILRHTVGPKSSFITAEKRARLRTNPVKVRFAEEVVVNGHSQGNSLLFLPNVLKVYLENGQTKAFKFEANTTVKDIVLTLKEKLSIHCIEHFALVLEQQYSISKLLFLHDEELIQQVVQKKESHDYRCLFRVCFLSRDPLHMLQEDPVAFEYLYLQSVGDVMQERFAVEMKCNTALRLAALHIQERLAIAGHAHKTSLKTITKNWGIENFVSQTLLRNMREKDLRKAISYHMKKTQALLEPRHKVMSASQVRLTYLTQLGELKSYSGKSFSATMMLQDRESMVSLLVGAKYGVSQVVNHKLNIMTTLTEFSSVSRVELLPESDKVSLVKIYLQDVKPITLMLESQAAKDLCCLVSGYCKLLVDSTASVFSWMENPKMHRISAEEGYVSRGCSDSEESSEMDSADVLVNRRFSSDDTRVAPESEQQAEEEGQEGDGNQREGGTQGEREGNKGEVGGRQGEGEGNKRKEEGTQGEGEENKREEGGTQGEGAGPKPEGVDCEAAGCGEQQECSGEDLLSEASDSCHTDSRFYTSLSSDSMDALEEDDLVACSSCLPLGHYLLDTPEQHEVGNGATAPKESTSPHPSSVCDYDSDPGLRFAELSQLADLLPSPPEASEEEEGDEEGSSLPTKREYVFTFEENDARHYYNICSNVTPDSARSLPRPRPDPSQEEGEEGRGPLPDMEPVPILQPPPGFGDSSSEDEFFDAQDMFTSSEVTGEATTDGSGDTAGMGRTLSLSDIDISVPEQSVDTEQDDRGRSVLRHGRKKSRKRRSFMETDFTSQVSFPGQGRDLVDEDQLPCPTVSSLSNGEGEPAQLESKPIGGSDGHPPAPSRSGSEDSGVRRSKRISSELMEMEPDTMEFKSVTALMSAAAPLVMAVRCRVGPEGRESAGQQFQKMKEGEDLAETGEILNIPENLAETGGTLNIPSTSDEHVKVKDSLGEESNIPVPKEQHGQKSQEESLMQQLPPYLEGGGEAEDDLVFTENGTCPIPATPPQMVLPPAPSVSNIPGKDEEEEGGLSDKEDPEAESNSATLDCWGGSSTYLALAFRKGISISHECLMRVGAETVSETAGSAAASEAAIITKEPPAGFKFQNCPSGIMNRLSTSTLRGKIQTLPWYLSRSQEALSECVISTTDNSSSSGVSSEAMEATEDTKEVTEVIDEVTEVAEEATEEVTEVVSEASEEVTEVLAEAVEADPCFGLQDTFTDMEVGVTALPHMLLTPQTCGDLPLSLHPLGSTDWSVDGSSPATREEADASTPTCGVLTPCESKQPQPWAPFCPEGKVSFGCGSMSSPGCPTIPEEAPTHQEVCSCQAVYTNCFSGALDVTGFDEELTVYEFSRQTQGTDGSPLMTGPPSSFSSSSSVFSSSPCISPFSRVVLPPSTAELSPLLSPLYPSDCYLPESLEDTLNQLRNRRYSLSGGFAALQQDVDELLALLQPRGVDLPVRGGQHHRETCADHFSENKRLLHAEARKLMSGCQRVTRVGQAPEETLRCLAESFRTLVQLASVCLWFSSCVRCEGRHAEALSGLREVARTFGEFAQAAEKAGGRKSCQDLSVKLLARQCTALTASIFCLTQLFRTLTAL
ncbi:FERM and PDZ domain-containing protein 1 [Anguilla anguilla]|uniref:FERM and PDZ domain-containing protein 1 n=1 Tax=Anguilla anguilla TaxID=7936 RepID=UPI0015B178DD|nr:FERM and PDZ domain-containing protein 1 [Anguilla anguilla]XP_035273274.1 FERM and PDZ domain-containing protein 1 [Anguilla anguilla]XP_035273275.1 FERM and PDZ domain-containing protein 1 [Anguilla anguilla]XP_035273276.1 FERM and PDZ domain-containing protein 1 [Anguilla anguilla]XP_035273277.1 FERM and PDZ domain-containing protein 1 [Anguilla anguilla]